MIQYYKKVKELEKISVLEKNVIYKTFKNEMLIFVILFILLIAITVFTVLGDLLWVLYVFFFIGLCSFMIMNEYNDLHFLLFKELYQDQLLTVNIPKNFNFKKVEKNLIFFEADDEIFSLDIDLSRFRFIKKTKTKLFFFDECQC